MNNELNLLRIHKENALERIKSDEDDIASLHQALRVKDTAFEDLCETMQQALTAAMPYRESRADVMSAPLIEDVFTQLDCILDYFRIKKPEGGDPYAKRLKKLMNKLQKAAK